MAASVAVRGRTALPFPCQDGLRCITCRRLINGAQRLQEGNESGYLRRIQVLPVSRHVAPALNDLAHKLIMGEVGSNLVQSRSAFAAGAANRMAIAALLHLEDQRALPLQR